MHKFHCSKSYETNIKKVHVHHHRKSFFIRRNTRDYTRTIFFLVDFLMTELLHVVYSFYHQVITRFLVKTQKKIKALTGKEKSATKVQCIQWCFYEFLPLDVLSQRQAELWLLMFSILHKHGNDMSDYITKELQSISILFAFVSISY